MFKNALFLEQGMNIGPMLVDLNGHTIYESGDVLRIEVKPYVAKTREQLIFYFTDVTVNSGTTVVHWLDVKSTLLLLRVIKKGRLPYPDQELLRKANSCFIQMYEKG